MSEYSQEKHNQQSQDDWRERSQQRQDNDYHKSSESYGGFGQAGFGDEDKRNLRRGYGNTSGNAYGSNQQGSGQSGQSGYSQGRDFENSDRYRSGYGNNQGGNYDSFGSTGSQYGSNDQYGSSSRMNTGSGYGNSYGQQGADNYGRGAGSQGQSGQFDSHQYRGQSDPYRSQMNYGGMGRQGSDDFYRQGVQHGSYGQQGQYGRDRNQQDRSWWDRTKEQVSSWFDVDDRQRMMGGHRGKGPKEYQRSAERIREDIYDRLSDDDHIDATEISVQVTGNDVVLTGTVNSREEKRHAEDLVEAVSGVKHVENRIRVGRSTEGNSSLYQNTGSTGSSMNTPGRTEGISSREYTGNTENTGGIGNESGTTNEIIRNANRDKNK